ncbi:MAG: hypothetical protein CL512_04685 [Actinobacteria bacterium]|nr:hypothetical protein [Actinomycetota bacterium]|tara:strand:- start:976 stop:1722 length:747 start_codon:yes stop_codon:yes gene_type:complete
MKDEDQKPISEPPKKRSVKLLWLLLVLLVLGVGAYATTQSSFLSVGEITVKGVEEKVTEEEVLEAAGIDLGDSMFGLDLSKADENVTSLSWVSEATVERKWPRSILITLNEREPSVIAVIPNGEKFLLDRSGVVLDQVSQNDTSLPIIRIDEVGVLGTQISGITPLLRAAEEVTPDLEAWILALAPTGGGVRAELVGGVVAELGIGTDFRDEMRSLATVLTRVQLSCIEVIDVSIHQNPVVTRTQGKC